MLIMKHAIPPDRVVARPARVFGSDLEAGREDQAVQLVLLPGHHDPLLRDPLHARALRIDEPDVGAIEGLQVLVVEAWTLAELAVVGLQRLGGGWILDDGFHPRPDFFHLREVGHLHGPGQGLRREIRLLVREQHGQQLADDVGPTVVHQVFFLVAPCGEDLEVVHSPLVPAGLQAARPLRIGGAVGSHVDGRRCALKHVEVLGALPEVGDALHRGRTGADHADALVAEPRQIAFGVTARVPVVPAAGVEGVALEGLDSGDPGQLGLLEQAVRHADEAGLHGVAAIRRDDPARFVFIPPQPRDLGLEADVAVEVELLGDGPGMVEDLLPAAVLLPGDVVELLEQRQVHVRLDVARHARIAVPIPGTAEVAPLLDDADVFDPELAQARSGQQPPEAASDQHDVDFVRQRIAGEAGLDIGIVGEASERALDLHVLVVAIGAEPLLPLLPVLLPERIRVEAEVSGLRLRLARLLPGHVPFSISFVSRTLAGLACEFRDIVEY
jgi:hypothetical protein